MAGAIAIIVVLLLLPVLVLMGGAIASALIGQMMGRDAARRHEGTELLQLQD